MCVLFHLQLLRMRVEGSNFENILKNATLLHIQFRATAAHIGCVFKICSSFQYLFVPTINLVFLQACLPKQCLNEKSNDNTLRNVQVNLSLTHRDADREPREQNVPREQQDSHVTSPLMRRCMSAFGVTFKYPSRSSGSYLFQPRKLNIQVCMYDIRQTNKNLSQNPIQCKPDVLQKCHFEKCFVK